MPRRSFVILALLAFSILSARSAEALPGNVLSEQKISSTTGGFTGILANGDEFGAAVANIGDLNGDTIQDLVVGASLDSDGGSFTGAAWILFMNANGTVASQAKISATTGGLTGSLDASDRFGMSAAGIGDLDGDTVPDIVVGADGDDDGGTDRGAVYVLFMNSNGTVKSEQKISSSSGGFTGTLGDGDRFGHAIAPLGDLDGDTVDDIAVGAAYTDGGGSFRGAVWILFMNTNGTVKSSAKIDDTTGGLSGNLADDDLFGTSIAVFDDLDGDTVVDLAVGAQGDNENGPFRGAVWILNLDSSGGVTGTQKINGTNGSFLGNLDDQDFFGVSVATISDLNDDGVDDLAVGAVGDDTGGLDRGQVYILFMNSNGTVSFFRRVNVPGSGFVGPLANTEMLGSALGSPRDLDGDGIADLVVGQRRNSDGGAARGAAWVLFMDGVSGSLCGDGILDPGEDCDDGNEDNGDCCDDSCNFEGIGSPCADGDVCNGDETCDGAGTCLPGAPLDCNDGMSCTQDTCDPILGCMSTSGPAVGCLVAGKANVSLSDKSNDAKDKLNWKWLKGEETLISDFADPVNTDSYTLCVYDTIADVPSLREELPVPPSLVNWKATSKGFKYKDSSAIESGVKTITLTAGDAGKPKMNFKAKGVNVPLLGAVGATYYDQDTSVIIQLLNSTGMCWTTDFGAPAQKNDLESFKSKLP